MIGQRRPDVVIVTTVDAFHHLYIISAMQNGCDVVTEKPMTIDAEKVGAVLSAVEQTGRRLTVTFNYRYAPASPGSDRSSPKERSGHLVWWTSPGCWTRATAPITSGVGTVRNPCPAVCSSTRPVITSTWSTGGPGPGRRRCTPWLARLLREQGGKGPRRGLLVQQVHGQHHRRPLRPRPRPQRDAPRPYRDAEAETGYVRTAMSSAKTSPSRTRWW